jgi:hypothetical protein
MFHIRSQPDAICAITATYHAIVDLKPRTRNLTKRVKVLPSHARLA